MIGLKLPRLVMTKELSLVPSLVLQPPNLNHFFYLLYLLISVLCPLGGLVHTGSGFGKHLILGLCSFISESSQF
jgi:hypothetical protein